VALPSVTVSIYPGEPDENIFGTRATSTTDPPDAGKRKVQGFMGEGDVGHDAWKHTTPPPVTNRATLPR